MSTNPIDVLRRELVPALLIALSAGCAVVAAAAGRDVVTALIGALLVVVYWAVERLATRIGGRGTIQWAMVVGVVGMVVRLMIVVGGLVIVGLVDRPGFLDAIVSFVVVYTVYLGVRLWRFPILHADTPAGRPLTHRHRSAR